MIIKPENMSGTRKKNIKRGRKLIGVSKRKLAFFHPSVWKDVRGLKMPCGTSRFRIRGKVVTLMYSWISLFSMELGRPHGYKIVNYAALYIVAQLWKTLSSRLKF